MPSTKKIDLQGDFAAGVYLSEAQNPILHALHTVYVYTVYLFNIRTGKGGGAGEIWTREKGRGATVHKAGQKFQHDWVYLQL